MHSTKTQILALLKRNAGGTVEELALSLGLASMTVRQHLTALERDGVVKADEVRRPTGRPHFRFRLTDDGHRRVAVGYDRLLSLLLVEAGHLESADVASLTPDERRGLLFRRAAQALGERHRAELQALTGAARIERIADILRSHGGFADWHERDGAFELRDFTCVYREHVCNGPRCEWHETFLTAVLGDAVTPAPPAGDGCAECCRYFIAARVPAAAGERGRG